MEGTGRWVAPDTVRRPQLPAEGAGMKNADLPPPKKGGGGQEVADSATVG